MIALIINTSSTPETNQKKEVNPMAKNKTADEYYTATRLAKIAYKYRNWSNVALANSIKEDSMIAYTLRIDEEIKRFDENPEREICAALTF